jgi:hypothetical protein
MVARRCMPNRFPTWMIVEQIACGVLLAAAAGLVFRRADR